ncbi:MAG: mechanosensitive ion channel [Pseudomonadales bacterium]|nr:mechanosensitive ion channel family protein [Pseudomonadales bacterium]NIX09570.1 mechanosensitive ion channel [Pseudomonadales bacterium]
MLETLRDYLSQNTWVAEVFAIVFATALVRYAVRRLFDRLAKRLEQTRNLYDDALLDAARRPLGIAIWVLGVSWAAEVAGAVGGAEIFDYVDEAREVAIIWLLVWFAVRFIRFMEVHLTDSSYREEPVDETTAAALGKLLRAAAIITGVLMAMQEFGFSIAGVLAFGGVGGIAVGFAARDLLANFFGALMIFLDRPFSVGDWIRSPDREIEGTVEDIGWRLTRIRTFDQRPLYVPNAIFTNLAVENPSRMRNRRIYETIGVRYDDVGVLRQIVADVESMLREHPDIDVSRTLMVNFVEFGASSLDFFVYTFTKTTVWTEFHAIKQDVLFRIADIIEGHGAEIAFPTQTLHVAQAEP